MGIVSFRTYIDHVCPIPVENGHYLGYDVVLDTEAHDHESVQWQLSRKSRMLV